MTAIIAIETATEACSAALIVADAQNNDTRCYTRYQFAPREHTKLILPMLDDVLAEAGLQLADMDAIAFGRGPGAFTGLRIATGIAQGVALSVDKPTLAMSSLAALALSALQQQTASHTVIAAIDARMGEVYWASYRVIDGHLQALAPEQLSNPDALFAHLEGLSAECSAQAPVSLIGSGWDTYLENFTQNYSQNQSESKPHIHSEALHFIPEQFPAAEQIAQLALTAYERGDTQTVEEAQPVYLRNNVAEKSKKPL